MCKVFRNQRVRVIFARRAYFLQSANLLSGPRKINHLADLADSTGARYSRKVLEQKYLRRKIERGWRSEANVPPMGLAAPVQLSRSESSEAKTLFAVCLF
jgi:hypothetical protein